LTTDVANKEMSAIDWTKTEVERLLQAEKDILARFMALRQELPTAREEAGNAMLATVMHGSNRSGSQHAVIQRDLEALKAAEEAAGRQRVALIKQVWKLQSQADREKAAQLREEANALDEAALPHVDALGEIWGCPPTTLANGLSLTNSTSKVVYTPTRAESLRNQATILERNAAQRETQPVSRNGHFEGNSLEEFLTQLHSNPMHVGVSTIQVIEWFDQARQMEQDRRSKVGFQPAQWPEMIFTLHYKDGVIDERESRAWTPPLY
jgi:hypothetical protein